MIAEIISIGTELLLGTITDTNAAFIASQLPALGIDLPFISTAGDNQKRLVNTIKQAWQRAEIIFTTGGLGPTQDDITREAIAELINEELTIDPALVQELQGYYKKRNLEMPKTNIKQASIIPSARIIPNAKGTAPGWWVEKEGRIIISMPGPPHEMQYMWTQEILPGLQSILESNIIVSKTLKTFGLGESKVDELISPLLSSANPTLATYAKYDGVHLRITAKANNKDEAEKMILQQETNIKKVLKDHIWGSDSDTLAGIIGELLNARCLSLASMESQSGGLLAETISNVSGSERYFRGGIIAYTDEAKTAFDIKKEIISNTGIETAELAEAMATTARNKFNSDIGIGITGVSDLINVEGKSMGNIFIGIDNQGTLYSFERTYPGDQMRVIRIAVIEALFQLRKILINK